MLNVHTLHSGITPLSGLSTAPHCQETFIFFFLQLRRQNRSSKASSVESKPYDPNPSRPPLIPSFDPCSSHIGPRWLLSGPLAISLLPLPSISLKKKKSYKVFGDLYRARRISAQSKARLRPPRGASSAFPAFPQLRRRPPPLR